MNRRTTALIIVLSLLAAGYAGIAPSSRAAEAAAGDDFPMVDYHVHLKKDMTVEDAKSWADARGMKYGIAGACGIGTPIRDDEGLLAFLEKTKDKGLKMRALDNYKKAGYDADSLAKHAKSDND